LIDNPFTYGNPISEPSRFFGRQREVEQIYSRLRNREAESSSIVGERRIGKTSLLNYLAHPDVRRKFGAESPRYVFIYSDLQMVADSITPERLIRRIMQQLVLQASDEDVQQAAEELRQAEFIDNFALADMFDVIDRKDAHVVLLLDEFEKVTANSNFGPDFFYGLRSLAIQNNLTLVTSSQRELIELTHSEIIKSSPFFNIFANINMRLFLEQEARELISASLHESGVLFSPSETDRLFYLAGFHPFFLQAACYFLFEAYRLDINAAERLPYMDREFQQEAAPHLNDYWFNSRDHEKIVLAALAILENKAGSDIREIKLDQLKKLYPRSEQTLVQLEKRCLVVRKNESYHLFNASFSRWILRELSGDEDELSYEEWLQTKGDPLEKLESRAKRELSEILPQFSARYRDLLISWVSDPRNLVAVAGLLKSAFT